ncbi:hypothetical protein HMPREF3182_00313 [Megasphaera hutchinsoni]|uniref:Uncharacterized protein n=1 Tax=Megasphaera hutchinsoni TaxID=1588748 RepID=A0A134CKA8_9FIRM|nr:hypothetical protein HMPREF3182_00313 [Megasphaera hutchinsoni]
MVQAGVVRQVKEGMYGSGFGVRRVDWVFLYLFLSLPPASVLACTVTIAVRLVAVKRHWKLALIHRKRHRPYFFR